MNRTAYHAAYYRDTAPRRRYLANFRKALRINCVWLLEEIRNHRDIEPSVSITSRLQPIRRPVLKLNCDAGRRTNSNLFCSLNLYARLGVLPGAGDELG